MSLNLITMALFKLELSEWVGLSPLLMTYVIVPLAIILTAIIVTKVFRVIMQRYFERSSAVLRVDITRYKFFKNAVSFIILLVAFIIIFHTIPELRALGVTLFAGAGIIAIIIGFASQAAFANIISGLFIVTSKPFRVGDYIKISDEFFGTVEDITLRHTVIRNNENRRIIIPNAVINNHTIINSNIIDEKVCSLIELGISYDSSIDLAIKIMQDEVMKHPLFVDNRTDEEKAANQPAVVVRVMGFGESSVNLRAYAWAGTSMDAFVMRTDLFKLIKQRFDSEGVEIPFPYRTIVMKEKKEK